MKLIPRDYPAYLIIYQAVIRLSKQFLPGMSVGFQHPKVKVHVGDGFKFLDDYKNEFDVIITDSSDPEGPAESLFQKPYFELLFGALKEGGVITTQGCTFSFISVDLVIFFICSICLSFFYIFLSVSSVASNVPHPNSAYYMISSYG